MADTFSSDLLASLPSQTKHVTATKEGMVSAFTGLDLKRENDAKTSASSKGLLQSKQDDKRAEQRHDALRKANKQAKQQEEKNRPETALTQALGAFHDEVSESSALRASNRKLPEHGYGPCSRRRTARRAGSSIGRSKQKQRRQKYGHI